MEYTGKFLYSIKDPKIGFELGRIDKIYKEDEIIGFDPKLDKDTESANYQWRGDITWLRTGLLQRNVPFPTLAGGMFANNSRAVPIEEPITEMNPTGGVKASKKRDSWGTIIMPTVGTYIIAIVSDTFGFIIVGYLNPNFIEDQLDRRNNEEKACYDKLVPGEYLIKNRTGSQEDGNCYTFYTQDGKIQIGTNWPGVGSEEPRSLSSATEADETRITLDRNATGGGKKIHIHTKENTEIIIKGNGNIELETDSEIPYSGTKIEAQKDGDIKVTSKTGDAEVRITNYGNIALETRKSIPIGFGARAEMDLLGGITASAGKDPAIGALGSMDATGKISLKSNPTFPVVGASVELTPEGNISIETSGKGNINIRAIKAGNIFVKAGEPTGTVSVKAGADGLILLGDGATQPVACVGSTVSGGEVTTGSPRVLVPMAE